MTFTVNLKRLLGGFLISVVVIGLFWVILKHNQQSYLNHLELFKQQQETCGKEKITI